MATVACLDFETANSAPESACSVGLALFRDGVPVSSEERLIRPHRAFFYFSPFNVEIHGIRPAAVQAAPEFEQIAPWMFSILHADCVVAHNAAFDISVLCALCRLYDMPFPEFEYLCTCKAARRFWPALPNHKLDTLSDHIGHVFRHHDAREDAETAGLVLLAMMKEAGTDSPRAFADAVSINPGVLTPFEHTPCLCRKRTGVSGKKSSRRAKET